MTTPEKCFPIRLMHHCQRSDETVLFLFGWVMSAERQQQAVERKKERDREGGRQM